MRRIQIFEWEDFGWFPGFLRNAGLDYLQFLFSRLGLYSAAHKVLRPMLATQKMPALYDLCSGGGGPIPSLLPVLAQQLQRPVHATFSDLYPNLAAWESLARQQPFLQYETKAVSLTQMNFQPLLVYTQFSAMHHFSTKALTAFFAEASAQRASICFFDGGNRSLWMLPLLAITHFVGFALLTPFIRPFNLGRLFFTYCIPLIPLYTIWDGCASIMKLHTASEIRAMLPKTVGYEWNVGYLPVVANVRMLYVCGQPQMPASTGFEPVNKEAILTSQAE